VWATLAFDTTFPLLPREDRPVCWEHAAICYS